jgi:hypothetical protein
MLEKALQALGMARACLKDSNVGKANRIMDELADQLARGMSKAIDPWQANVLRLLDSLGDLGFALDQGPFKELNDSKDQLILQAGNVKVPTSVNDISTALNAVHDLQIKLTSFHHRLSEQIVKGAEQYGELLKTRGLDNPEAIADLERKALALSKELEEAARTLDPSKRSYGEQTSNELRGSYRGLLEEALSTIRETMTQSQLDAITTATGNGRYFEAARVLPLKVSVLKAAVGGPPPAGPQPPWRPQGQPPAGGRAVTQLVPIIELPKAVEVTRARTLRQILWAKTAQTLFVGVGITVVGYLLFAENFVGTVKELAVVYFWGFGLDVSMDNLLGQVAKLGGPKK